MKGTATCVYYVHGSCSDPAGWNISLHTQEKETISNQATAYRIQYLVNSWAAGYNNTIKAVAQVSEHVRAIYQG